MPPSRIATAPMPEAIAYGLQDLGAAWPRKKHSNSNWSSLSCLASRANPAAAVAANPRNMTRAYGAVRWKLRPSFETGLYRSADKLKENRNRIGQSLRDARSNWPSC